MNRSLVIISLLLTSFLFGCIKSSDTAKPTPVPTSKPRLTQIDFENPPKLSLTPRADGHELKLIIASIPPEVAKLEYELTYKAKDGKNEIEKGLGDTVTQITPTIVRDLLLGTSSCTNGCKYRYDEGITGGSLKITYLTNNSQVNQYNGIWTLVKTKGKFSVELVNQQ